MERIVAQTSQISKACEVFLRPGGYDGTFFIKNRYKPRCAMCGRLLCLAAFVRHGTPLDVPPSCMLRRYFMSPEATFAQCPNCGNTTFSHLVMQCPHCGKVICESCQKYVLATEYCPACHHSIDFFSQRILGCIFPDT